MKVNSDTREHIERMVNACRRGVNRLHGQENLRKVGQASCVKSVSWRKADRIHDRLKAHSIR